MVGKPASWIVAVCERSVYKSVLGSGLGNGSHFAAIRVGCPDWCYVPGGNSVTFGLESPLVCLWEGYE